MKKSFLYAVLLSTVAFSSVATSLTKINQTSPSDPGVINQERILYWLEKRGQLSVNANAHERAVALENYINKKSFEKKSLPGVLGKQVQRVESLNHKKTISKATSSSIQKTTSFSHTASANEVETTVKVLAIMIDFPDLKYNDNGLTSSDTNMYYSDYSPQHYNDLLFSHSGYTGPSGQNIISAYQYYQQESGGTFFFTGQAHDWVTADHEAKYYGENDEDNNFDDKNVPALVLEAVTKAVENGVDLSEYDQVDTYDFDNDGVLNEPDGIIDHVMIFHSSVGEEAGGGVLAEDAIWSHRFFVFGDDNRPVSIPGSSVKLYGYTINPIDAATGVTVHEFGHDLGLDDEYDTDNGALGSPVGNWSVMSSGSWLGYPGGTSPATFSALARDYLSQRYQGNWINQLEVDFETLATENINLVAANNHIGGINQVKVNLPPKQIVFGTPIEGEYQYYSGKENQQEQRLSFTLTLPSEAATLNMTARWNIETDWDYLQVLVNGTPISGSHTQITNEIRPTITNYISGSSADFDEAYGELSWIDLSFDLAEYADQSITIELNYKTDEAVLEYGFVADQISVQAGGEELFFSGGENNGELELNGFSRIKDTFAGKNHNYYIQLRDHSGTDEKLADIGYDAGILLWYRDENTSNNQVNNHPGEVFIGVVDADQNLIKSGKSIRGTETQIRDAAFSLFDQSAFNGDNHLTAVSIFDDKRDYSSPFQPESGIQLPRLGLSMKVVAMEASSDVATIELANLGLDFIEAGRNGREITLSLVAETIDNDSPITWNLGDGTILTGQEVTHTYASDGQFDIAVTYNNASELVELTKAVTIAEKITGVITPQINGTTVVFTAELSGGLGEFIYRWNFGDGSDIANGAEVNYTYESFGQYTVTLSVVDETTVIQNIVFALDLQAQPLEASFSFALTNLQARFTSSSTGGEGSLSYLWDFGDGGTSSIQNPIHTYSAAGTYNVILKVTDGEGTEVESTSSVTVTAAPVVVTPPVKKETASSSGGGSFGLFTLLSLLFVIRLKTRQSL